MSTFLSCLSKSLMHIAILSFAKIFVRDLLPLILDHSYKRYPKDWWKRVRKKSLALKHTLIHSTYLLDFSLYFKISIFVNFQPVLPILMFHTISNFALQSHFHKAPFANPLYLSHFFPLFADPFQNEINPPWQRGNLVLFLTTRFFCKWKQKYLDLFCHQMYHF